MKLIKRLFISSIILMLTTTSILASASVNKKTNASSLDVTDENSLGTLKIIHYPLGKKNPMEIIYEPPLDFDYYFPQDESGYVYSNFTLNVKHRLGNPKEDFPASRIWPNNFRFTGITVWIMYTSIDICYNESIKNCNTTTFEEYNISITYDEPLFTNNSTLKCKFKCGAYPAITPVPFIQLLCKRFLYRDIVVKDIWIHPLL